MLKLAFNRFDCSDEEYLLFKKENEYWLDNYSLFMAIKNDQVPGNWLGWEEKYAKRDSEAIENFIKENENNIEFYKFIQFQFTKQWNSLKKYANDNGILIIGDIPIYVSPDSVDVWKNPELFCLDNDFKPTLVAGVPPDAFSYSARIISKLEGKHNKRVFALLCGSEFLCNFALKRILRCNVVVSDFICSRRRVYRTVYKKELL